MHADLYWFSLNRKPQNYFLAVKQIISVWQPWCKFQLVWKGTLELSHINQRQQQKKFSYYQVDFVSQILI